MAIQEEYEKQGWGLYKYGGFIPAFFLMLGYVFLLKLEGYPQNFLFQEWRSEEFYEGLCLLFSLLGFLINAYTAGYTPSKTSFRNDNWKVPATFQTKGLYSIMRHPLYLGKFVMWMGPALITGKVWFIISYWLFCWLYFERVMFAEEKFMRSKFGHKYNRWSETVPAFIPNILLFKKPRSSFQFKEVFRQEKSSLVPIFLSFFIFDAISEMIDEKPEFNYFILTMLLTAITLYLCIEALEKFTVLLETDGSEHRH
ncbi:MAG: methyltransferase family protein [Bacteroidia bacterium]